MSFPLKADYATEGPLCQVQFGDLNTIAGMLNGVKLQVIAGLEQPEVVPPGQNGENWTFRIPSAAVVVPAPPATGDHVLVSQNGALAWVPLETFECPT